MNKYSEILKKINALILERYILLNEKGIDWVKVSDQYKSKIQNAKTNTRFVEIINNMLFQLEDPHVTFFDTTHTSEYYLPFVLNFSQNSLIVTTDSVIPKDSIILKVNGTSISDLINSYENKIPLTAIKMRILQNIYHNLGEKISFQYSHNGKVNNTTINNLKVKSNIYDNLKQKNKYISFNNITTKKIDNNINYIKIGFFGKDISEHIYDWIVTLQKGCKLIIDLRGCKGGYVEETIKSVSLFLDYNVNLGKKGFNENGKYIEELVNIPALFSNTNFSKIAVLADSFTMSSAEFIFLRAILKNKNITFIGEKTAGIINGTTSFTIDNKYLLTLTTSKYYDEMGNLLTYEGINPDILVPSSSNNFDNMPDECLNQAILNLQ